MTQMALSIPWVFDRISSFLPREDETCLGSTCKTLYLLYLENEKFRQIADFVIKNYAVSGTVLSDLPFWLRLKVCPAFLIGESHIEEYHRRIFGTFVNAIWEDGACTLFLEGNGTYLPGTGPLSYVRPDIAVQQQTWDLEPGLLQVHIRRIALESSAISVLTGQYLSLCDAQTPEAALQITQNCLNLLAYFHRLLCPEGVLESHCIQTLKTLERLILLANQAAREKNVTDLIYILFTIRHMQAHLSYLLRTQMDDVFNAWVLHSGAARAEVNIHREKSLETCLVSNALEGKRGIAYGGISHMRIKEGQAFLADIPFLSLIPLVESTDAIPSFFQKPPREVIKEFTLEIAQSCDLERLYRYLDTAAKLFQQEKRPCMEALANYEDYFVVANGRPFHPRDLFLVGFREAGIILDLLRTYLGGQY